MKKYILGMIAIIMIVVSSAFTMAKNNSGSRLETTYWFLMDASGTNVTTAQVTDPSTLCPNQILPDCARKYNESQTEVVSGIRQVKSGEVDSEIDFRSKE